MEHLAILSGVLFGIVVGCAIGRLERRKQLEQIYEANREAERIKKQLMAARGAAETWHQLYQRRQDIDNAKFSRN